ncbi:transglutaminaseTgpA domain-containing protein [Microbacterium sp.]|uniref:transglutaminase family protein n=1 Tax=Microbacterium sp. TaxID=51671 RepID=UPI003A87343D
MSSGERTARAVRAGNTRLAIGLLVAVAATVAPLAGVIRPGSWLVLSAGLAVLLLVVGWVARRLRAAAPAVAALELGVWVAVITALFFEPTAWFGVVPTLDTLRTVPAIGEAAITEIVVGVAPMTAGPALTALLVAAVGLLVVALDHVVVTARMPLLATAALVAVWVIPALAVPSAVNVVSFVFLAAAALSLIRAETRTREERTTESGGVAAVAVGIGVVAIVGAVAVAPALPEPVLAGGGGPLGTTSIDPSLDLGDDLRQPDDRPVLRYRSSSTELPYLRVSTLSWFDGEVWQPDRMRLVPLDDEAFEPVVADEGVRVTEYVTTVEVTDLSSAWAPVPFPAVGIEGLDEPWRTMPYNRTLFTPQGNVRGSTYSITTHVPRPTREQIAAADATIDETRADVYQLPDDLPDTVRTLAAQVTADADTDYGRMAALQSWFRGPEFEYSLTAPVEEGFDGTSSEAISRFLQEKSGYCVHFASAFAVMARAVDLPARVVVGFLPGGYTGEIEDGERVAEATTSQLHAWPEVYFEGIGWVGFEPTKGLGEQTSFLSESVAPPPDGGQDVAARTPTATPTSTASAAPLDAQDPAASDAAPTAVQLADLRPYLVTMAVLLTVALTPAAARMLVEGRLRRRAASGDVTAAWTIVQNAALDVRAPVPAAQSPRAFGASLSRWGAGGPVVTRLVTAMERAAYAPDRGGLDAAAVVDDALAVRRALLTAAGPAGRARALLLPRSLVIRPGSTFATPLSPAH